MHKFYQRFSQWGWENRRRLLPKHVEKDQIELTNEFKIRLHKNGVEVDIVEIVADLEHNIEKGIFYEYIDHKLTAEENGLKALNYQEFIRLKKWM